MDFIFEYGLGKTTIIKNAVERLWEFETSSARKIALHLGPITDYYKSKIRLLMHLTRRIRFNTKKTDMLYTREAYTVKVLSKFKMITI